MSIRFNLEFPDDYKTIVSGLMEKTKLRTQKDVFDNALAIFGWAIRETAKGRIIASMDEENKSYAELQMPALMAAAEAADNNHDAPEARARKPSRDKDK